MKEKIDLSLNRSLPELESSYWEFLECMCLISLRKVINKYNEKKLRFALTSES